MDFIKIYILEDEIVTQEVLKECLEEQGYEVVGMADNAVDALTDIIKLKPDIAILDINVKGEYDGIWLANQLEIPFIFLTAFSDKKTTNAAFKTQPSSYLLKPFNNSQVCVAIDMALQKNNALEPLIDSDDDSKNKFYKVKDELIIKDGYKHYKVNLFDINFIKSDSKYIELHIENKKFVLRHTLINFLNEFSNSYFVQVHKSYIVNMDKVESYKSNILHINNIEIPISRTYKSHFYSEMERFLHIKPQ